MVRSSVVWVSLVGSVLICVMGSVVSVSVFDPVVVMLIYCSVVILNFVVASDFVVDLFTLIFGFRTVVESIFAG